MLKVISSTPKTNDLFILHKTFKNQLHPCPNQNGWPFCRFQNDFTDILYMHAFFSFFFLLQ